MVAAGTKSRDILATLREEGMIPFQQDVYNFIAKVRKELQKAPSPAEAFVQPPHEGILGGFNDLNDLHDLHDLNDLTES